MNVARILPIGSPTPLISYHTIFHKLLCYIEWTIPTPDAHKTEFISRLAQFHLDTPDMRHQVLD